MSSLGLYIHWPFCVSKCPYCDFNSHVRAHIDEEQWCKAYLLEMAYVATSTKDHILTSVFFGGGTPSLMDAKTVGKIIDELSKYWTLDDQIEITLEANPNSVEYSKFQDFKAAGINRLSLGIQSLREDSLKFLGRAHGKQEATAALKIARKLFERYSFDLIYARPDHNITAWEDELNEALEYAGSHISLYQLTLEKGTAFYAQAQSGRLQLPKDEIAAEFYYSTQNITDQAGLPAYEISNHARAGHESKHNMLYWQGHPYAAMGPGAHGRHHMNHKRWAIKNYKTPENWLSHIENKGHAVEEYSLLTPQEWLCEYLMMGLRLSEGISQKSFLEMSGQDLNNVLDTQKLDHLIKDNLIEWDCENLKLTFEGRLKLNAILRYIIN